MSVCSDPRLIWRAGIRLNTLGIWLNCGRSNLGNRGATSCIDYDGFEKTEGRKWFPAFALISYIKSRQSATKGPLPPAFADRSTCRGIGRFNGGSTFGFLIRSHDHAFDLGL